MMIMLEKQNINKSGLFTLIVIYFFLYMLNYLTPLGFGDDYLYSFIWQGNAMNHPLPLNAGRVLSFSDLLVSQWSHYVTWGGRTVAHSFAQFFLWKGKDLFNLINAFVGTLLVAEIYWCIHKGKMTFSFEPKTLCWIFFVLWAFTPGFTPVFLWLTGACNYLWSCVLLTGFVIPYIKKYYDLDKKIGFSPLLSFVMFFFGIISGWTNENSVCWVIMLLCFLLLKLHKKNRNIENWMYAGLAGLILGYIGLLSAPGNIARLNLVHGSGWNSMQVIQQNGSTFLKVIICQLFLWYFVLRSLNIIAYLNNENNSLQKDRLLVTAFAVISFGMTAVMLLAPEFPERSGFPGTVWLIVAAGTLLRIQIENDLNLINSSARRFLFSICSMYFVMTSVITVWNFYDMHEQTQMFLHTIKGLSPKEKAVVQLVSPPAKADMTIKMLSGFHIIDNELSEDENSWENVSFARYYGIMGVRVVKE